MRRGFGTDMEPWSRVRVGKGGSNRGGRNLIRKGKNGWECPGEIRLEEEDDV